MVLTHNLEVSVEYEKTQGVDDPDPEEEFQGGVDLAADVAVQPPGQG